MSEDAPRENPPAYAPPVSSFTGPVGELIAQRMLSPPSRPGLLAVLNHFEILRVLGGGGMGIVLLARDAATGHEMAVKLVKSDLVTNQNAVHRFLKETGHLKRLRHTNIVPVEEISARPEGPYFVMPYFEKGSLAGRIKPGCPLDTGTILDIAIPIAEGLSFAHRSGIIHRDLKPANILLGANDRVCLADFGLARTLFNDTIVDVESRQLEGTAPYVSPAIAAGDAEDTRCDIYSFGALLYEMLTGEAPYQGRGTREILDQILAGPPKPITDLNPTADSGLVIVAESCMARELRDRYADMRDVLKDLRRVQEDQPPVGVRETRKMQRAPKLLPVAVGLAGLALLAWAGWLFWRGRPRQAVVTTPIVSPAPKPKVSAPAPSIAPGPASTIAGTSSNPPAPIIVPAPAQIIAGISSNESTPIATPGLTTTTAPIPSISTTTNVATVTPPVVPPPTTTKPGTQLAGAQPVVNDIVKLYSHGLSESVIATYARDNPPKSPLTAAESDYLEANGVPQSIIDILRSSAPAPVTPPAQPVFINQNTDVHSLLKTAHEKYTLHDNQEAIAYCNRALSLDPGNPDAWCIKAISEEAARNSAAAITAYTTFLQLPAAKTPQYLSWRSYATARLRALRGW